MTTGITLTDQFDVIDFDSACVHAVNIYRSDYRHNGLLLKTLVNGMLNDTSFHMNDKIEFLIQLENEGIIKVDDFILHDTNDGLVTLRCKKCGKFLSEHESNIGLLCWKCANEE